MGILAAGRSRRAHDLRGWPFPFLPEDARLTSNVGQNFPYASETETERAAAVEAALAKAAGLREKVAAETTPLEPDADRWWVYVCPTDGTSGGRLHAAGYALELHAVYTVCDLCGSTFLR
jgi:hypothetical protein